MRLLHAGHRAVRQGPARRQSRAQRSGDPPRHRRQPVPLHRLRQDRRGHRGRGRRACGDNRRWPPTSAPQARGRSASGCRASMPASASPARRSIRPTWRCRAWCTPSCCAARTRTRASRRIDTTRAAALKGVLAVVTAADFPELPVGASIPMGETGYDMWMVAQINMARHKVHWVGQPVAGVAAVDVHVAEAALALIDGRLRAARPPCSISPPPWRPMRPCCTSTSSPRASSRARAQPSNVCSRTVIARGDATRALAEAPATARVSVAGRHRPPGLPRAAGGGGAGRCQRLRHRVGLHAGPVHRRADDRAHARDAAVAAQGRAARDRRRLRRQDRHPRRGRGGAPGAEVRPPGEAHVHARGGAAGRLAAPPPAR